MALVQPQHRLQSLSVKQAGAISTLAHLLAQGCLRNVLELSVECSTCMADAQSLAHALTVPGALQALERLRLSVLLSVR